MHILLASSGGNMLRLSKHFVNVLSYSIFKGQLIHSFFSFLRRRCDFVFSSVVCFLYAHLVPINDKQIFFIPFQGDYTCNPKYIAEEFLRRKLDYKLIFSARKKNFYCAAFPKEIILVEQYSVDYYKTIAKSKVIIANSVEFLKGFVPIKKKQILIETWHGSLGIKRFDASSNNGKAWVRAAKKCGKWAKYVISNSIFENDVYKKSYWPHTEILEYGHPRNDILMINNTEVRDLIRKKVFAFFEREFESEEMHFVLYAPTFRDNHTLNAYNLDYKKISFALQRRFGGSWLFMVRLHPTVRKKTMVYMEGKPVIDVTDYPDIQELMLIADVAITDYSSCIYDFLLTGKPGFIFATDIRLYETERGFYFPLSETPFSVSESNEALVENICSYDSARYAEKVDIFLHEKGCWEGGTASRLVVDKILEDLK